jgi:aminoglycoside N3'-acetyltransferase
VLYTTDLLAHQLRALGLKDGAIVMPHASLRKLGPTEGGANGVIDSIQQVVGSAGTIVMIVGARENQPFDAQTTPAESSIGTLAEVFRKRPDTRVNDHAVARFAATGLHASNLLERTPLHDYYGPDSVLERFTNLDGVVLRLGSDLNTVTLTHWAEYLAQLPTKRTVRRCYERADTGAQWIQSLDDSDGLVDWLAGDYFTELLKDYLATGRANVGTVGSCTAELLQAKDYVAFATRWLESNL